MSLSTEQAWHDQRFAHSSSLVVPQRITQRYLCPKRRPLYPLEKMFSLCGDVRGKRILVLGCGDSTTPALLAMAGAEVSASDISLEALRVQARIAAENKVCVRIVQEDMRATGWPAESFDIVFGAALLHHVPEDVGRTVTEIRRILHADGIALFSEPVCLSPLMRALRRIVPVKTDLSPDERQLTPKDIRAIAPAETWHFHCFSRLRRLVPWLSLLLAEVDKLFLSIPAFRRFAGICVWQVTR